jgi:hypothetical protein
VNFKNYFKIKIIKNYIVVIKKYRVKVIV